MKNEKDIKATIGSIGEFGFIEKIRQSLKTKDKSILSGIGDDAAIFKPTPGNELVFTTDMLVEGRHFDWKYMTPWQLGAKTMAVNISDCAAMGAKPTVAVVSLGIPKNYPVANLETFYDGMKSMGESFGAHIVGGDTVGSDQFVVNVALIGEVEAGKALRRSGAKVGDALFVTGTLGDSAAGLYALKHPSENNPDAAAMLVKRHLAPTPRFTVGRVLSTKRLASAAIDISDGLSSEVHHLCDESKVGAEIHEEALPLSPSLITYCGTHGLNPLDLVLGGGEDYELLFSVPLTHISQVVQKVPGETGTPLKAIGRLVPAAKGVTLITRKGERVPLKTKGFDHFSN